MNRRTVFSLFVLIFISSTLTIGYILYSQELQNKPAQNGMIHVVLEIDYSGILPSETHEGDFEMGKSVYEITSQYATLKTKNYSSLGIFVEGINGVLGNVNISNYYWLYYVNGVLADRACNLYFLQENSTITWIYTKPSI